MLLQMMAWSAAHDAQAAVPRPLLAAITADLPAAARPSATAAESRRSSPRAWRIAGQASAGDGTARHGPGRPGSAAMNTPNSSQGQTCILDKQDVYYYYDSTLLL